MNNILNPVLKYFKLAKNEFDDLPSLRLLHTVSILRISQSSLIGLNIDSRKNGCFSSYHFIDLTSMIQQ
jgi:hypothetical protein